MRLTAQNVSEFYQGVQIYKDILDLKMVFRRENSTNLFLQ